MANPAIIGDGLHVHGGVTSAVEARQVEAGLWARSDSTLIDARTGVVWAGDAQIVTGTATVGPPMTVTVKPLHFVGVKANGEGVYRGVIPTLTVVDVAAAPGTNSRIDVVWVAQEDAASPTSPDGVTQGVVGVTTGTAAPSPVKPTVPVVGAVELATVRVSSGDTSTSLSLVTQTAQWTAVRGTPTPVPSQTVRDAIFAPQEGLAVMRLDARCRIERYTTPVIGSPSWGIGWDEREDTYNPVLTAATTNPTVGSNGWLRGYWQRSGSRVNLSIYLRMGNTGWGGGAGAWSFTAPFAAAVNSRLSVSANVPNAANAGNSQPKEYMGTASIDAGSTAILPYLPYRPDRPGLDRVQSANSSNTIGTGVPRILSTDGYSASAYTWANATNGTEAELRIFGSYIAVV